MLIVLDDRTFEPPLPDMADGPVTFVVMSGVGHAQFLPSPIVFPGSQIMDTSFFEMCRSWLETQPGMKPWDAGCTRAWQQLTRWLEEYSQTIGSKPIQANQPHSAPYLRRLWNCWSYHWRSASEIVPAGRIDGLEVANRIRGGKGYFRGGLLGGDVLRDVVLAEAVIQKNESALQHLEREYKDYCLRQGKSLASFPNAEDWWYLLLDKLAGFTQAPGKLASFSGRCGLQNWLGTVVRNWMRDRLKKDRLQTTGSGKDLAELAITEHPEQFLISEECRHLWVELLQRTLASLEARDRLLLRLRFAQGLTGKETAAILGIHPGNVSRREQRVLEHLRQRLQSAEVLDRSDYRECLQHLLTGKEGIGFAQALVEALEEKP